MPGRILVVFESRPAAAALRRGLESAGFQVDVAGPDDAAARLVPGGHLAALVMAGPGAERVVAGLRRADGTLSIVGVFEDEAAAEAGAGALGVHAALVSPVARSVLAAACRLAARASLLARRVAALEGPRPPGGGAERDLDVLKRQLFAEVKRSRRYSYPLAVGIVAIDGWPEAGPRSAPARAAVLAGLLGTVTEAVRGLDLAVPYANDQIVVLMPHTRADGALLVSRRICARVRERGGSPALTVSVGVAGHAGDAPVAFSTLARRASDALARARGAGGNRAEPAEPARRDRISLT